MRLLLRSRLFIALVLAAAILRPMPTLTAADGAPTSEEELRRQAQEVERLQKELQRAQSELKKAEAANQRLRQEKTQPAPTATGQAVPERLATRLLIPAIDVDAAIVSAPVVGETWDIAGLFDKVAYLEGTAYPGGPGNAVVEAAFAQRRKTLRNNLKGLLPARRSPRSASLRSGARNPVAGRVRGPGQCLCGGLITAAEPARGNRADHRQRFAHTP